MAKFAFVLRLQTLQALTKYEVMEQKRSVIGCFLHDSTVFSVEDEEDHWN